MRIAAINEIYLCYNPIDDECMHSLGGYIQKSQSIESISFGNNPITDEGIEILTPYLDGNTTFKRLSFWVNKGITDMSVPLLVKMIESSHIDDIRIYETSIIQQDAFAVPLACNKIKQGCDKLNLGRK